MTYRRPLSATVTTRTMQALPMTTPRVVKNARTLLAQRASSATIQVSLRSIMWIPLNYTKPVRKDPCPPSWDSCASLTFISSVSALILLPLPCYAGRARATPGILPPLRRIVPGIHTVCPAIPARPRAAAYRNYRGPWRYRISRASPHRRDFSFASRAKPLGKTSTAGHSDLYAPLYRPPRPFFLHLAGRGSNHKPRSKPPPGRNSLPKSWRIPHPPRASASSWRRTPRGQAAPESDRSSRALRYASSPYRRRLPPRSV